MSLGKIVGVIGSLLPLVYIGYMLRHFIGVGGGTAEGIAWIGLGPTVIGLSIVGILFALPLIVKLVRAGSGLNRVPGAGNLKPGEVSSPETIEFDADAAFANYMRGREASGGAPPVVEPLPSDPAPVTPRPGGFGRKIV